MNTQIIKSGLLALFLLSGIGTFAQPPMGGKGENFNREEAKTLKVGIYTRVLNLTPKEAEIFWPVFNEFEEKMHVLREEEKSIRKSVEDDFSTMKDAEVEKNIDRLMALKTEENKLVLEYYEKYKKILPIKKVALIHRAEMMYKHALLEKMRGERPGRK